MKKKLFTPVFLLFVVLFPFNSGLAQQDPNDPGFADTLYFTAGSPCSSDGDTLYFPSGGGDVTIHINMWNDESLLGIVVPLIDSAYGPPSNAFLDSSKNNGSPDPLCFQGSRVEHFFSKICNLDSNPPSVLYAAVHTDSLLPGDGLFATMTYTVSNTGRICLDTTFFYPVNVLKFVNTESMGFTPQFVSRCFHLLPASPYVETEKIRAYRGGGKWTKVVKSNYGREGAKDDSAFWWDPYGNTLFDGSYVLGNDPFNLAFYGGANDPPGEFLPSDSINYYYYLFPGKINPQTDEGESLGVNVLSTSYFHNNGLPDLDIDLIAVAWDDFEDDTTFGDSAGYGAGRVVTQVWILHNRGPDPIEDLRAALWLDWNLHPDPYLDQGIAFEELNWGGVYNMDNPDTSFGVMFVPLVGQPQLERYVAVDNGIYVHPHAGWGWDRDSLWNLMDGSDWNFWDTTQGPYDMSTLMTTEPFSLAPSEDKTIIIIKDSPERQGSDYPWYMMHWCTALKFMGFYRGDMNNDGRLNVLDFCVLTNYLFLQGTPPKPFVDQGDVNADGMIDNNDMIYLLMYLCMGGSAPIDYPRFPAEIPFQPQPSLFTVDGFDELCKIPVLPCGDANGDGEVTISDIVYLINFILKTTGPPPKAFCDVNCNYCEGGADPYYCPVDVTDITYLIEYLLKSDPDYPCQGCPL
jgi:hypothetical protein